MQQRDFSVVEQLIEQLTSLLQSSRKDTGKVYLLVARNVGEPTIYTFENIEQCINHLIKLKDDNIDAPIYTYIFEGVRWVLTKHPVRGLKCGDTVIPLPMPNSNAIVNGETNNLSELF